MKYDPNRGRAANVFNAATQLADVLEKYGMTAAAAEKLDALVRDESADEHADADALWLAYYAETGRDREPSDETRELCIRLLRDREQQATKRALAPLSHTHPSDSDPFAGLTESDYVDPEQAGRR